MAPNEQQHACLLFFYNTCYMTATSSILDRERVVHIEEGNRTKYQFTKERTELTPEQLLSSDLTEPSFFFFFSSFISLIADGPHHYHPACGHKRSSHLSPVHALQLFIAMLVQHSYNSSTNG